jgi:hypothetical protein
MPLAGCASATMTLADARCLGARFAINAGDDRLWKFDHENGFPEQVITPGPSTLAAATWPHRSANSELALLERP